MCYHILPITISFAHLSSCICVCVRALCRYISQTQFACMRKSNAIGGTQKQRQRQREADIVTFSAVDVVTALEQWILLENWMILSNNTDKRIILMSAIFAAVI